MANVQIYFGIENLNLTNPQRSTLVTALQALGTRNGSPQPAERNHWRIRPDSDAVIFEALFNEDNLDIAAVKAFLATAMTVSAATISHATQQSTYGLIATFTHSATDQLRMIAFGYDGGWPDWLASGDAARAYLAANAAAWGEAV